jgi:hypothetical protein
MESIKAELSILEELVCTSKGKELRLHRHPQSGRHWVEVGGRRLVSTGYIQAAKHLHAQDKLSLKHEAEDHTVYELGHHVCSKIEKA